MISNTQNKIIKFLKSKRTGVFCDDSNLYHAYQKYGWRVDFEKFKKFLDNFCDLQFIHYHIAIPDKSDYSRKGTENFLNRIRPFAEAKKKQLKYTPVAGKFVKKGDTDVEIVLDVVKTINNLDVIIILSGDSDFCALRDYAMKDKKKNIVFWGFEKNMAWELKYSWHLYLDDYQEQFLKKYKFR